MSDDVELSSYNITLRQDIHEGPIGTLIRGSVGTEVCIGCIGSVATKGVSYSISFDLTKISILSPIVI